MDGPRPIPIKPLRATGLAFLLGAVNPRTLIPDHGRRYRDRAGGRRQPDQLTSVLVYALIASGGGRPGRIYFRWVTGPDSMLANSRSMARNNVIMGRDLRGDRRQTDRRRNHHAFTLLDRRSAKSGLLLLGFMLWARIP